MIVATAANFVSPSCHFPHKFGFFIGNPPQYKESRFYVETVQQIERLYRVPFKPRLKAIPFITFNKTIEGTDVEVVLEQNRQNMLSLVLLNLHRFRYQYRPPPDVVLRSTRKSKLRF